MYSSEFYRDVAKGHFLPAYVFTGGSDEEYREAVDRLRAIVIDQSFSTFNLLKVSGREGGAKEAIDAVRTRAMGQGGRLVILSEVESLAKPDIEELLSYIKKPDEDNCLIVDAGELDYRHRLISTAKSLKIMVDFRPPLWEKMEDAVLKYLGRLGLSISPEALNVLLLALGDDRGLMRRELEKVALFVGDNKKVEIDDLRDLLVEGATKSIFVLTEHLQRKEMAKALRVLDKLLEEGEYPGRLIYMMAREYRLIWMAREGSSFVGDKEEPFKELNVLPQRIKHDLLKDARQFSQTELAQALVSLREVDRAIKSSSVPPRIFLESFLFAAAGKADGEH